MIVALIDQKIVSVWFRVLINRLRIVPFDLALVVMELYPDLNIDSETKLYLDRFVLRTFYGVGIYYNGCSSGLKQGTLIKCHRLQGTMK